MYKNKFPYQLIKGQLIMLNDFDHRKVRGVMWSPREIQYRVDFEDGSFIFVSKIKTIPVFIDERKKARA